MPGISNNILAALSVRLTTDASKFSQGINQASQRMDFMKQGATRLAGTLAGLFSVTMLLRFGKQSMELYDTQVKAETSLLTALDDRWSMMKNISDLAAQLQQRTLFGDEETIEAASRLAQVLGTNETAIKRLLPLVQDLAQAREMQLVAAADLVAKSVGSSTNALSRYGIQIEGTVGSAERLESAVKALNDQVGGQAEAAALVGLSIFKQLSMAWGDYREQLGRAFSPENSPFAAWLKTALEADTRNMKLLNDLKEASRYTEIELTFWDKLSAKWGEVTWHAQEILDVYKVMRDYFGKKGLKPPPPEILPIYEELNKKLQEQKDIIAAALPGQEAELARAQRQVQIIQKQIKAYQALGVVKEQEMRKISPFPTEDIIPKLPQPQLTMPGPDWANYWQNQLYRTEQNIENFAAAYQKQTDQIRQVNMVLEMGIENLAVSWAESLGQMMAGAKNFNIGQAILNPLADMIANLGRMLIMTGIGVEAFKTSLKTLQGAVAVFAGTALVALASAIKSSISSLPDRMGTAVTPAATPTAGGQGPLIGTRQYGERRTVYFEGFIHGDGIRLVESRAEERDKIIT